MNKKQIKTTKLSNIKSIAVTPFLFVLLFAGIACNGDWQTARGQFREFGAESPEAVVARIQKAVETGDLRELAACMDPGTLRQSGENLYFAHTMTIAFSEEEDAEQRVAQFNEVTERHGLPAFDPEEETEDAKALEEALGGLDHAGLIGLHTDLIDLMISFGMIEEGEENSGFLLPEGELAGLVIDGNRASGTIGEEQKLEFVRIDGRWYMTM